MKKFILSLLFLYNIIPLLAINNGIKVLKKDFNSCINNVQIDTCKTKIKYVKNYGAIGDGYADDTQAIQRALDDGHGIVILEKKHKIEASLINSNNNVITYFGDGKSEIISSSISSPKFTNTSNLSLKNIKTTAPFLALNESTENYDNLIIENCDILGVELMIGNPAVLTFNNIYNYAIKTLGNFTVKNMTIKNSNFESSLVFYMASSFDGNIEKLFFVNNNVLNFRNYVIAPMKVNNIYFTDNTIDGNLSTPGNNYRVLFRTGTEKAIVQNNSFKNIKSYSKTNKAGKKIGGASTVIYGSGGDLYYQNNKIENITGDANSHIIADKSSSIANWVIRDNIFDQTLVINQKLQAIIKAGNNKIDISNNIFITPKMTSIQYGYKRRVLGDSVKKNFISNNQFLNVESVIVIQLLGNLENVIIKGNKLIGMTNPLNHTSSFDRRCRFISVMNTKLNNTLKNITISNNFIQNISKDGSLFFSNTFKGGGIYNLKFINNSMSSGEVMLRYRNIKKYPIHSLDILYNSLPTKMLIEETPNINSQIILKK